MEVGYKNIWRIRVTNNHKNILSAKNELCVIRYSDRYTFQYFIASKIFKT